MPLKSTPTKVVKLMPSRRERRGQLLEQLFTERGQDVVHFISQRARRIAVDPEDVAQEVFSKLAGRKELLDDIREGKVNVVPYLFSMANNLVSDIERKQFHQHKYEASLKQHSRAGDSIDVSSPESFVVTESSLAVFKQVIEQLKPTWREAFLLNRFKYLSYPEVARKMGVSVKQVENYIAQALIKLREAQQALERSGEWP